MSGNELTIKVTDSLKKIGKSLEDLAPRLEDIVNETMAEVAYDTYLEIMKKAQTGLNSTKEDYLKGLSFTAIGRNSWVIELDGTWANKLEQGFPAYALKDVLLNSQKLVEHSSSSRAGEPWVRTSKRGKKYAAVPFEHSQMRIEMKLPSLDVINPVTKKKQKITNVFKDLNKSPIEGKVGSFNIEGSDSNFKNLTKYQYTDKLSGRTKSVYMTFRMISEESTGFIHPGFDGLHAFKEAEEKIAQKVEDALRELFGN
jgi:hypothetical protein